MLTQIIFKIQTLAVCILNYVDTDVCITILYVLNHACIHVAYETH